MALNFNNICRFCMGKKDSLQPIFNDEKGQLVTLSAKIMNFVPLIKIFSGDGLPAQVCRQCLRLINSSYKFKQQCENSDTTLRDYLNNQTCQENDNDIILHSVFQSDDWKLTSVKKEGTVEENSKTDSADTYNEIQTILNESDTDDNDDGISNDNERISEAECPENEETDLQAGTSEGNKKVGKKQKKNNILINKRTREKRTNKKCTVSSSVSLNSDIKSETEEPSELENFDISINQYNEVKNEVKDELMSDIKIEPCDFKVKMPKVKEKKSFLCHDCGKNFARKQHLLLHLRTHTGEKPFACKVCGESFGMSSNLNKHMRIHTGERPFLCTMCGKCFGRSDTLTKHMRCHTGEKPFHCNVCGNNFGRSSTLINHMRTHLGEKPYLCTECGRRFVQSYDLTKHMRSHTGEKPYRCTVCRTSFGQKNSLNKHMRSHTPELPFTTMEFHRPMPYVHYRPSVADLTMERGSVPVFISSGSQMQ